MRRNHSSNSARGFTLYSSSASLQNTTSESPTEPESVTPTSSGTMVSRRYVKNSISE